MYICICHGVTDRDIRACIEDGTGSMRELRGKLKVGTQCGKCACQVRAILEEATSASTDPAQFEQPAFTT
jgi:bacterioferritin-associated ferredoxin